MAIPMPGSYVLRQNQGLLGHLLHLSWLLKLERALFLMLLLFARSFQAQWNRILRWRRLTSGRRRRAYLW